MDEVILAKQLEAIHTECDKCNVPSELGDRRLTAQERVVLLAGAYLRLDNLYVSMGRSPFRQ